MFFRAHKHNEIDNYFCISAYGSAKDKHSNSSIGVSLWMNGEDLEELREEITELLEDQKENKKEKEKICGT